MSRRGCPGLCAESLPQPSISAVCPYNTASTVVHGKFLSLKAAFLSPLSLLLWVWLFCKANLERALSFQTEIHTHSFSFHLCNTGSVVQRMQYYFWQQNCGRKLPCVFLSHPTQRDLVIVLEIERGFFFKAWLLLSLLEEKSSHVVFRGQDIIRYCLYLFSQALGVCFWWPVVTNSLETQTIFEEENCMVFI